MSYKIFGDSCLDLTEELKKDPRFEMIPLTLQVDDHMIMDDETFDQKAFLAMVKASPNCPKTACPSPEAFKKACECDADDIYIITLSSHLSGTYNSAVLGKELYEEEHGKGKKNILVIDSESASAGELNEALAIRDMYEEGLERIMVSSSSWIRQEVSPRDWPVCASLPPGVRVSRRKSARSSHM